MRLTEMLHQLNDMEYIRAYVEIWVHNCREVTGVNEHSINAHAFMVVLEGMINASN